MRDFYFTYNYKRGDVMKTKIIKIMFAFVITLASFNAFADSDACGNNKDDNDKDTQECMETELGE